MSKENTKNDSDKFGKVVEDLHNKSKLSSLRTYQGDMAEFIKDKNESVFSIAAKEKLRKEDEERAEKARLKKLQLETEEEKKRMKEKEKIKKEKKAIERNEVEETKIVKEIKASEVMFPRPEPKPKSKSNFQTNLMIGVASLLLVVGGVFVSLYIFKYVNTEPVVSAIVDTDIIPYNDTVILTNITGETLGEEIAKLSATSGVSLVKITNSDGLPFEKSIDFFNSMKISVPRVLERTLSGKYMIGVFSQNGETYPFISLSVNDFGNAFSAMLDWEKTIAQDLSFLVKQTQTIVQIDPTSTTTNTNSDVDNISESDSFNWRDIIIKNKDTRGLVNQRNQAKIAYTFLDKNTILISNNVFILGDISAVYVSRSIVR